MAYLNQQISYIPHTQTAALVDKLGGPVRFDRTYRVPQITDNEVLAKVLYTGVCQSDLHTKSGTASGPDGNPITDIKLPHVGGHEGVGRIVAIGKRCPADVHPGQYVGIRFASRVCRRCWACLAGTEQYCVNSTNHLHHEDGAFQEYIALDADYLCLLPDDIDPVTIGPVLCAGLTAYKAVLNCAIKPGQWVAVVGAGGGLGHFAVQYAKAFGARVCAIDGGDRKREFCMSLGADHYIDFRKSTQLVREVRECTDGGVMGAVVAAAAPGAFALAADLLRTGGTLSCVGIPPEKAFLQTPISSIVIRGLHVTGNLVGSLKECHEAVDFVRRGQVKPHVTLRRFEELPRVYEEMERDQILGRVVLKVAREEHKVPIWSRM